MGYFSLYTSRDSKIQVFYTKSNWDCFAQDIIKPGFFENFISITEYKEASIMLSIFSTLKFERNTNFFLRFILNVFIGFDEGKFSAFFSLARRSWESSNQRSNE